MLIITNKCQQCKIPFLGGIQSMVHLSKFITQPSSITYNLFHGRFKDQRQILTQGKKCLYLKDIHCDVK